jgi:rubrerythrin
VELWNSLGEVLDYAIGEEEAAADFYSRLALRTKVPGMKSVFEGFAQEEIGHKEKLQAVKAGITFLSASQKVMDLRIAEYVVDVKLDPFLNYRDALVLAMKKEKAAFRLYSILAESMEDQVLKTTFLALAQEEAKHKLRFELEYDDLLIEN